MKRILLGTVVAAALVYLANLGTTGQFIGAVVFYALAVYVVWRAWPAIRADLRRLAQVTSRNRGYHL